MRKLNDGFESFYTNPNTTISNESDRNYDCDCFDCNYNCEEHD